MSALEAINLESLQLADEFQETLMKSAEGAESYRTRRTVARYSRYNQYDLADISDKRGGSNLGLGVARGSRNRAACKGGLTKRHLVEKRAITASSFSVDSPECPALHAGTEKLRPHTNLCRDRNIQRGIYYNHDTKQLSLLDKRDYPLEFFVCEHFVELDTIERAYRGELRNLVNTLLASKDTNAIGNLDTH